MILKTLFDDKWKLLMWGSLFLLFLFTFISFYYPDIYITYRYSLTFLDCIKNGEVFDFYKISLQTQNELGYAATYFIPIYILFAIWNFPIWIITRWGGVSAESAGCLLWSKGLIVVFAVASVYVLVQIMKKLSYEEIEYTVFLFTSSLLFVCPSLAMSQYDIIECFFILCGIYFYLSDEKISWRVLLFFSIAVSMKLLALFIFFILILLTEKRILHIAVMMLESLLVTIVTMIPFWGNGYKDCADTLNQGFIDRLFTSVIPGGISSLSIFWIGFTAVCLLAYLRKTAQPDKIVKQLIWYSAFIFVLFFTFVFCHPQWIVLFLPFVILPVMEHKENRKINLILEIILEVAIILVQGIAFYWVYFSETSFEKLILESNIKYGSGVKNLLDVLEKMGASERIYGVYSIFFVCGIALLIINNPWRPVRCISEETSESVVNHTAGIVRILFILVYVLATCIIAFT